MPGDMFKGAFIGFIVALLMLLPPVLHFVTGPLGPFIGGYIGGSKAKASILGAMMVGFLMSLFMVAPMIGLLALGSTLEGLLPRGLLNVLVIIGIIIVVYTGLMGTIGAAIGGLIARKSIPPDSPTSSS